jgi:hypothetical protein
MHVVNLKETKTRFLFVIYKDEVTKNFCYIKKKLNLYPVSLLLYIRFGLSVMTDRSINSLVLSKYSLELNQFSFWTRLAKSLHLVCFFVSSKMRSNKEWHEIQQ